MPHPYTMSTRFKNGNINELAICIIPFVSTHKWSTSGYPGKTSTGPYDPSRVGCCCCFPGHWYVKCLRIMRCLCPNLRTRTPPELGSVANFYVAIFLKPDQTFSARHPMSVWGGLPAYAHYLYPFPTVVYPHRIIFPTGCHLYPSQHNVVHCSLH